VDCHRYDNCGHNYAPNQLGITSNEPAPSFKPLCEAATGPCRTMVIRHLLSAADPPQFDLELLRKETA
jgi:hypothetical protein